MDLSQLETNVGDSAPATDPTRLLGALREGALETMAAMDDPELSEDVPANEYNMARAFLALDDWLSRGGFLPAPWKASDGDE